MNLLLLALLVCAVMGFRARPGFLSQAAVVLLMTGLTTVYWLTGRI